MIFDIPELWYNAGVVMKRWAPVVICGSLLLGWIVMEIFRKNKEVRKWALQVLILKVPGFTFVFVYVYMGLYGVFNF